MNNPMSKAYQHATSSCFLTQGYHLVNQSLIFEYRVTFNTIPQQLTPCFPYQFEYIALGCLFEVRVCQGFLPLATPSTSTLQHVFSHYYLKS
jgi:hypothetical protein